MVLRFALTSLSPLPRLVVCAKVSPFRVERGVTLWCGDVAIYRAHVYFEDALRFYEESVKEFEEGVKENNPYKIRDSAEKRGTR